MIRRVYRLHHRGVRRAVVFLFCLAGLCLFLSPVFSDASGSRLASRAGVLAETGPFTPHDPVRVSTLLASPFFGASTRPAPLRGALNEEQTGYFDGVTRWMKYSMIALGVNTGALILSFIEPTVGGIVGILSLGGWAITTGYMAFNYRDLSASLVAEGSDLPLPTIPSYASIGAASLAMGAITAIGLSFSDYTGTAQVLAYICTAASGVSGIIAMIRTYRYAEEAGYTMGKGLF